MDISGMFVKMHDERLLFTGRRSTRSSIFRLGPIADGMLYIRWDFVSRHTLNEGAQSSL
jgi:hypothetical protein